MTVEEILADLGIPAETIAAKKDNIASWNGKMAASATEAAQKLADAQKALQDAQNLKSVIDADIAANGVNESNLAQLRASNAAMTAALAEVKKAGFTGITIPDFPTNTPAAVDPITGMKTLVVDGFTKIMQLQNAQNKYQRIFGKPLPDDPTALADEAAARRLDVNTWAEQKYGFAAAEQTQRADAAKKHDETIAAKAVEDWKAAHPVTNGHPELGAGVPSNYPNIPKPSDAKGVREMAGKSPMEKIKMARDRVSAEVKTKMAAA